MNTVLRTAIYFANTYVLFSQTGYCQDVLKTNPKEVHLLQDTAGARLFLVTLPPGGSLEKHTHPAFLAYILQGGTIEESYEDGTKETAQLTRGMNMKSPPMGVHSDKNIGKTTIKILMVE